MKLPCIIRIDARVVADWSRYPMLRMPLTKSIKVEIHLHLKVVDANIIGRLLRWEKLYLVTINSVVSDTHTICHITYADALMINIWLVIGGTLNIKNNYCEAASKSSISLREAFAIVAFVAEHLFLSGNSDLALSALTTIAHVRSKEGHLIIVRRQLWISRKASVSKMTL